MFFSPLLSSNLDPSALDKENPLPCDWRQAEAVQGSKFNRKWEVRGGEASYVKTPFTKRRARSLARGLKTWLKSSLACPEEPRGTPCPHPELEILLPCPPLPLPGEVPRAHQTDYPPFTAAKVWKKPVATNR